MTTAPVIKRVVSWCLLIAALVGALVGAVDVCWMLWIIYKMPH